MPLLLDTTVLIDALRGRPAAQRILRLRQSGDVPLTCAINVEELWRGVRPSEEPSLVGLIDGLRIVTLGRSEGRMAGQWRRDYAATGHTLHQADCLIAAAAVTAGVALATGNPDDFPMTELRVEHWPVNE